MSEPLFYVTTLVSLPNGEHLKMCLSDAVDWNTSRAEIENAQNAIQDPDLVAFHGNDAIDPSIAITLPRPIVEQSLWRFQSIPQAEIDVARDAEAARLAAS